MTPKPSFYSPFFYSPFALLQCQKEIAVAFGIKGDRQRLRIAFTTKPWNLHEVDSECAEAAKLCEDLGHHVEEASPSRFRAAMKRCFLRIQADEIDALYEAIQKHEQSPER